MDVKLHSQADVLANGKRILLFLGRIAPKKGLVNLIHAWSNLRKADAKLADDWVLVIAGMDVRGHEAELKRMVGRSWSLVKMSCSLASNPAPPRLRCFIPPVLSFCLLAAKVCRWEY